MTFTIQEIRKYIESQDSLGDALYNLSEESIAKANRQVITSSEAYLEGRDEYVSGKKCFNPYRHDCEEFVDYQAGWKSKFDEDDSAFY